MPETEFLLEDIPAPGEPLKPKIHEDNLKVLEEEVNERTERLQGKLTTHEYRRLNKRYKKLWKLLNKRRWNELITQKWQLSQKYEALLYAYNRLKQVKSKVAFDKRQQIKAKAETISQRGKALQVHINDIQAYADEFQSISHTLNIHRSILAFEREEKENYKAFKREAYTWFGQMKACFKQSKRLHHAGYDARGKWYCHIPKIQRIFFKEDRALFLVKTSKQNWLKIWSSALPYNVDVDALTSPETLTNLSAHTNRVVSVERSKSGQNLFYVINRQDSPDGIPRKVLYSKLSQWYPVEDHSKTPWPAGVTNDRKAEWYNLEDYPHILVAGSTKSGKSNQINAMIATFVTMNSPAELRLMLVDNKGGIEFTHWEGIKHAARPMIKRASEVLPALQWARAVMERRLMMFEAIKAKNLPSFNAKVKPESRLPRLVIVIDELATLLGLGDLTTDIQTELRVLSSQGRAVGLNLIVCTQHSSADVLPGWIKTNMVMRISGKMPSHHASMVVLDSANAANLPDVVGRMIFALGRHEVIAQTAYISDSEVARAVEISREFDDANNAEFDRIGSAENDDEDTSEFIPIPKFSESDLINTALERLEGKLAPTRLHEILGNEVISLRELRRMCADFVKTYQHKTIVHQDTNYRLKKWGRGFEIVLLENANNAGNTNNVLEANEKTLESTLNE